MDPPPPSSQFTLLPVSQVCRQDEEGLEEGDEKGCADHQRDHLEHLAHDSRNEVQGHECGHVGEDAEGHGGRDLACPQDGGVQKIFPLLVIVIDIFSNDDGVVHHDTYGHNEGEKCDHVDGDAQDRKEEKGAQKGNRDSHHHPEGQAEFEENAEDHEDQ